ncbi:MULTISPECIES: hypothetical protein [Rhodanobacter]|uniref:hypothetical protein n=1 Tax=Rhodanobacter TaxID=75309 RepID=UPI0012DF8D59|nr:MULTISPECIES: hypothetical protein [Rhodanobacter]UJJ50946.1 hypothetical protein LRK52_17180 [Rhodanobacter denitrificans]UJM93660.1 hypothetical protein LRK32_17085 [Rhodanobacter denitrificans]UJM97191.1 hypothetical protein LRK44_17095 [Rhodanobacter denitrificans]UJN19981.1 hypothetical protein LRK54_09545 [Rhodanobacter denitrificans]
MLISLSGGAARATSVDLAAGGSVTSGQRLTSVAALDVLGTARSWKGIEVQPDMGLSYVAARRYQGGDFDRSVWVAAAGIRLPELWHHMFFSFQLGAATPRTKALSSTQQFVSSLGWSRHGFAILIRHVSNGGTRKPNLGETMLLVGVDMKTP